MILQLPGGQAKAKIEELLMGFLEPGQQLFVAESPDLASLQLYVSPWSRS